MSGTKPASLKVGCIVSFIVILIQIHANAEQLSRAGMSNNRTSEVVGSVMDSDGQPLAFAHIRLFQLLNLNGRAQLFEQCSTATDSNGNYQCLRLRKGHYVLEAELSATATPQHANRRTEQSSPFIFYPGTTDLASASPVELQENQLQTINLNFGPTDSYLVTAHLENTGQDIQISISAITGDGWKVNLPLGAKYDPSTGTIRAKLPSGLYELSARWLDEGKIHEGDSDVLVQHGNINDLTVRAATRTKVEGKVDLDPQYPSVVYNNVLLERRDGGLIDGQLSIAAIVWKGKNTFVFPAVPPGDYVIHVTNDRDNYLREIIVGSKTYEGCNLDIMQSADELSIELVMDAQSSALYGTAHTWDEDEVKSSIVAVSEESGEFHIVSSDDHGSFLLTGLAPGTYRVYAWKELDDVAYRDAKLLARYRDQSTEVSITRGGVVRNVSVKVLDVP